MFLMWAASGRAPVMALADQPGPEGRAWISLLFEGPEIGQMRAVEELLKNELEVPRLYQGTLHSRTSTRPFFVLGTVVIRVDSKDAAGLEMAVRRHLREQLPGNDFGIQLHRNESGARSRTVTGQKGNPVLIVE